MGIGFIILNAVLMGSVVLVIAGGILWAIATQHRDHGVASTGALLQRKVFSHTRRSAVGSYRPEPRPAW